MTEREPPATGTGIDRMATAALTQPLQVILRALHQQSGQVPLLCFPLDAQIPAQLPGGQQQFLAELTRSLPPSSQQIVLHGGFLDALVDRLRLAGHQVVLVDPGAGAPGAGRVATLAEALASGPFDCYLQPGSVLQPDLLILLQEAMGLVRPGGLLLWSGEFLSADDHTRHEQVPLRLNFERLVRRLGLQIEACQDVTSRVYPGLAAAQQLLDHQPGEPAHDLLQARKYLDRLQAELGSGNRLVLQYELRKPVSAEAAISYAPLGGFSIAEVAPVFEASFGHAFNPVLWEWKYGQGRGRAVAARKHGRLVAHYGGAPRDIIYFGARDKAIQICDVMVLPEERRQYGQESLFFKAAATFLEREIGFTVEHLLGFGFPNLKTMHLAVRLGLYEKTDDFVELQYLASTGADTGPAIELQAVDLQDATLADTFAGLWQQMQADLAMGVVGVRDVPYLDYRYRQHPYPDYQVLLARQSDTARPMAIAVVRPHEGWLLVMDLIGGLDDLPAVLAGIAARPGLLPGHHGVKCWITAGWQARLLTGAAHARELKIEIPCHSWSPGPASSLLYGKWWLTAGDMDFL